MTIYINNFKMNHRLQEALKDRFNAKWDKSESRWTVSSKAKAEQANQLIQQVKDFESGRMMLAKGESYEAFKRLNQKFPGIIAAHPLTNSEWVFVRFSGYCKIHGGSADELRAEFIAQGGVL